MLPTLDARLTAAAQLVRPGQPVADIGCDHGKLTAVLAASGRYQNRPPPMRMDVRRMRSMIWILAELLTRSASQLRREARSRVRMWLISVCSALSQKR